MKISTRLLCAASAALLFFALGVAPRRASAFPGATIAVNSWLDPSEAGKCTLRDAIIAANTNAVYGGCPAGSAYPAVDTITIYQSRFACQPIPVSCIIALSSPLPAVSEDVIIQGGTLVTQWRAVISGNYTHRVFDLQGVNVTIANINIIRGNATGTSTAGYGGAINTSSAGTTLTVSNAAFYENHAQGRGGAIHVSGGTTVINNSTFSGNTATGYGGALGQYAGVLIVNNSTLAGNSAGDGGALEVQSSSDTRLTNVTISGNSAVGRGGGISRIGTGPTMTLNNVTISGNTADSNASGFADGGGIYRGGGAVLVANSIIAGNFDTPNNAGPGTIHPDCSWPIADTMTSFGYNLLGIDAGCKGLVNGVNGDQVGTLANPINPWLGPLAYNGGPTQTQALLPGSPAIDAGNPNPPGIGACATTDQRGIVRPVGARCDTGAYEAPVYARFFLPVIRR